MTATRLSLLKTDLLVAAAAAALLLAWDFSGLDLVVMRHWGDASGFRWKEHWVTQRLLHDGGRVFGFAVLALLLVNIWRPLFRGPGRSERVRWVVIVLVCVTAVPALKQFSTTDCPWDLAEFGGVAQYVSHWRFGVSGGGPGRCFPSGHATAAFGFLGGWFVLRQHDRRLARWWLAGVLVAGLAFAWAQMVRGAHPPSHSAWSAWLCWVIGALLAPRPAAAPASAATAAPGR